MRFLRRVAGVTVSDKVRSLDIRQTLQIEPTLLHVEYRIFLAVTKGKRTILRPRTSWCKYMEKLSQEHMGLQWPEVQYAAKIANDGSFHSEFLRRHIPAGSVMLFLSDY